MSSGFRVAVTRGDTTKVKAYTLALAVQMLGLPLLFAAGLTRPSYPLLFPLGAVVGGLLFGACMTLAGGCAAGVWYKVGSGNLTTLIAVVGMALGAAAMEVAPLSSVRDSVHSVGAVDANAVPEFLWVFAPLAGIALLAVLLRAKPGSAGAWSWRRTGLLMGLVGIAAWPLSSLAGRDFGMAVIPGTVDLLTQPASALASWDVLFVLGIPLGAHVAARLAGSVRVSIPSIGGAALSLAGGLGLGIGASLAAGCTVGHGLTGVPLLGPGSILAMVSIFAGSAVVTLWRRRRESESSRGSAAPQHL